MPPTTLPATLPHRLDTTTPSFGNLQEDGQMQPVVEGVTSLEDDRMATIKARDKRQGRRSLHQLRRHSAPTAPQVNPSWSETQVAPVHQHSPSPFSLAFVSRPQQRHSSTLPPPPVSPLPQLVSHPAATHPLNTKQPQVQVTSNHTPSPGELVPRARDMKDGHSVPETPAPLAPLSTAWPTGFQTLEATPASLDGNSISSVPSSMTFDSIPSCRHSKDLVNQTHNGTGKTQVNDSFRPSLHARIVESTAQPSGSCRSTTTPACAAKLESPGHHSQPDVFSGSESDEGYATPLEFQDSSYVSDSRWATVATFEHAPSPLMANVPLNKQLNSTVHTTPSPVPAPNNRNNPYNRPLLNHPLGQVQSHPPPSTPSRSPYHPYFATNDNGLASNYIPPRHRQLRSAFNNDNNLGASDADYVLSVPRWAPWALLLLMLLYWYWVVVGVLHFMGVWS